MEPTPPQPRSHHVTINAGTMMAGSADMRIFWKAIVIQPSRFARRTTGLPAEIRHTIDEVWMIEARLGIPWFNTALVLGDDGPVTTVAVPGWRRRSLRVELSRAGFVVREMKTWFDLGDNLIVERRLRTDSATAPGSSGRAPAKLPDRRLFWLCSSIGFGCGIAWLIAVRRGSESVLFPLWVGGVCASAVGFYLLYRADRHFLSLWLPRTWRGAFAWWGLIFRPPTAEERSPVAWSCWALASLAAAGFLLTFLWTVVLAA